MRMLNEKNKMVNIKLNIFALFNFIGVTPQQILLDRTKLFIYYNIIYFVQVNILTFIKIFYLRHTHHCRFYGENKKISNTLLYVNQFNVIVIFKPLTTVISSQEQK